MGVSILVHGALDVGQGIDNISLGAGEPSNLLFGLKK